MAAANNSVKVNLKFGKQVFPLEIFVNESVETLRLQIFSLTNVPPERQKIMGLKGGILKDDANLATLGIKEGQNLMLMGSVEELAPPPEKVVFVEDLAPEDQQALFMAGLPPGLSNLGNTCYMNSTIQCLRSVNDFAKILTTIPGGRSEFNVNHNLALSTRDIFRQLESSKAAVAPYQFTAVLRSAFPQFAERGEDGNYSQQDAEECLTSLITAVSSIPQGKQAVEDTFGVDLETTFVNLENEEEKSVDFEKQTKLLCHLGANISLLMEGLRKSMEGTISKRSSLLGRDCDFKKQSKIAKLPPFLFIQEVRFDWRPDTQKRAKILRAVKFDLELDLIDLVTDNLKEKLAPNRPVLEERRKKEEEERRRKRKNERDEPEAAAAAAEGGGAAMEGVIAEGGGGVSAPVGRGGATGKYQLSGVITHQGRTAEGGHYMAWIRAGHDEWHRFDDDKVSVVNDEEIKKLTGGGDWHMAYILLYKQLYV